MKVWFLMVGFGEQDRVGNNAADEAADFGRRRVDHAVIDARVVTFLGSVVGGILFFVDLHQVLHCHFQELLLNHDGNDGTAPDPLGMVCWCPLQEKRRLVHAVRDRAVLNGPPAIWFSVPASAISVEDVAPWPYTVSIVVKWVAFLGHPYIGLLAVGILEKVVVSYVEMLILF